MLHSRWTSEGPIFLSRDFHLEHAFWLHKQGIVAGHWDLGLTGFLDSSPMRPRHAMELNSKALNTGKQSDSRLHAAPEAHLRVGHVLPGTATAQGPSSRTLTKHARSDSSSSIEQPDPSGETFEKAGRKRPFTSFVPRIRQLDGIDLSFYFPRPHLVRKMLSLLEISRFLVIAGPCGIGKTSLLQELREEARRANYDCLYVRGTTEYSGFQLFASLGIDLVNQRFGASSGPVIIMFDDCHRWFNDTDFWDALIKQTPIWLPSNVKFVFSATSMLNGTFDSFFDFRSLPNMTRDELLLTRKEFDQFLASPMGLSANLMTATLKELLWNDSCGLFEVMQITLNQIQARFVHEKEPSEDAILAYYLSDNFIDGMARVFGNTHSAPVSSALKEFLIKCLVHESHMVPTGLGEEDAKRLATLKKTGLLVEDYTNYPRFPSPLARRFYSRFLFSNRSQGNALPSSLASLVQDAIRHFSASRIWQSTPYFHMLLIEAITQLTPSVCNICLELSALFPDQEDKTHTGRIGKGQEDIYINNGAFRWGIEVLVQDRDPCAYVSRFKPGGKYRCLNVTDYVVVDFRKGPAVTSSVRLDSKRITVFFTENDFSVASCVIGMNADPLELTLAS